MLLNVCLLVLRLLFYGKFAGAPHGQKHKYGMPLDNFECACHYNDDKFSILARGRSFFRLSALEATFIKSLKPILCKQKEFVFLKLS